MGIIYETSIYPFIFVSVIIGGGAAFMIGRATAKGWKPFTNAIIYCLLLGCAVRFLHWGLFNGATLESWRAVQGTLISPHYYAVDTVVLILFAALGFRLTRTSQMLRQYGWLYESSGPFGWRRRRDATVQP
jgi:hypothetical protein